MLPIEVRPEARAELHEAFAWYEEKQAGLGQQFLTAVDATISRIRRQPGSFPLIQVGTRKALLRRFPYAVLFEVEDVRITVIAVYHGRRKPHGWSDRISEPRRGRYAQAHDRPLQPTGVAGG
ncbi:MAG: type II toxin-antitoxin system RelE/ParE family toxin [Planctomycetota bacterium]